MSPSLILHDRLANPLYIPLAKPVVNTLFIHILTVLPLCLSESMLHFFCFSIILHYIFYYVNFMYINCVYFH